MNQTQYVDYVNKKTKSNDHLLSSCPILTPIKYNEIHDKIEHWKICKYYGIPKSKNWYKHQPE